MSEAGMPLSRLGLPTEATERLATTVSVRTVEGFLGLAATQRRWLATFLGLRKAEMDTWIEKANGLLGQESARFSKKTPKRVLKQQGTGHDAPR